MTAVVHHGRTQREHRGYFTEFFGSDLVVAPESAPPEQMGAVWLG